jgi:hypothetical protein
MVTLSTGTLRGYAWDHLWDSPYLDLRMSLYHSLWGSLYNSLNDSLWTALNDSLRDESNKPY